MSLTIRTAKISDLEALLSLYRHLHRSDIGIAHEVANRNLIEITKSPNLNFLLGFSDDKSVASCYLNIIPNLTRGGAPYGIIENVVTHANYRRRGYGTQMVQYGLKQAWQAGCYKVMLMTGNPAMIPFYEACGFNGSDKSALIARPQ